MSLILSKEINIVVTAVLIILSALIFGIVTVSTLNKKEAVIS